MKAAKMILATDFRPVAEWQQDVCASEKQERKFRKEYALRNIFPIEGTG
ncbi:hypothetical protein [Gluconobacter oxydans]